MCICYLPRESKQGNRKYNLRTKIFIGKQKQNTCRQSCHCDMGRRSLQAENRKKNTTTYT